MLTLAADVGQEELVRACLVNLSVTGAYIILECSALVGAHATLSFRFGAQAPWLVGGRIVRFFWGGARTGIGVAFEQMDPDAHSLLHGLEQKTQAQQLALFQKLTELRLVLRAASPKPAPAGE